MADKIYRFVGQGQGVPGLPHVVSYEGAEAMGVLEILEAAIENGNYIEDNPEPTKKAKIRVEVEDKE